MVARPSKVPPSRIQEITVRFGADRQPEMITLTRMDGSTESPDIEQYRGKATKTDRLFLCHSATFSDKTMVIVGTPEENLP